VNQLKFTGVKAVKVGQLRAALATAKSSKFPWGAKHYFTRDQFDADLKRITAFYRDRGYPDAKVKTFDVKLNQKQDAVDITVDIDEGRPTIVEAIEYNGFEVLPPRHFSELKNRIPLKTGQPLDRALAQVTRESALDEVKDHGYPYASVRLTDRVGSNDHARVLTISTTPGTLARSSSCGSSPIVPGGGIASATSRRASGSSISSRRFSSRISNRKCQRDSSPSSCRPKSQ
jgi:translocation and assembly module TamA